MTETGTVRGWHADEGWGVLDSTPTPGGCWCHFSAVAIAGYRELHAGQQVDFEHETADQDGFDFRATRVWPTGAEPVDDAVTLDASYISVRIEFD